MDGSRRRQSPRYILMDDYCTVLYCTVLYMMSRRYLQ